MNLQGRVRVPTGGIAHEPQGMIRCDSGADSRVWMEEDPAGNPAAIEALVYPGLSFYPAPRGSGGWMDDRDYMRIALGLAVRGEGHVSPNPMVGAVIVKDGRMIGEGWHQRYGGAHAERNAIASLSESAEGAVMYVTLEPCCHYGHQPPCTDAIIDAGIRRVVVASSDPNPLVAGNGTRILREHGIEVTEGILKDEADRLNGIFFHYITTHRPFVAVKYAMTADGKIASHTGASRWITGTVARESVHRLRKRYTAVMTGAGTVLADDPLLTCRIPEGRNPVRIILDSNLRTPLSSRIVSTAHEVPTIIATCSSDYELRKQYTDKGCNIITVESDMDGHVDIPSLLDELGKMEIDSILSEGGGSLSWSLFRSGCVDKVYAYISPMILGGRDALTPVEGDGVDTPDEAFRIRNTVVTAIGDDFLLEGEVERCSQAS